MTSNDNIKLIPLTQGYSAIVDADCYECLMRLSWRTQFPQKPHWPIYAVTDAKHHGRNSVILMHRLLMREPDGVDVDHKNNNGLDNRLDNLRICNQSQNSRNSLKRQNTSSKYKGVCWHKVTSKWMARIKIDGVYKYLGIFASEAEAAAVYNEAALSYFKEFARINII